MSTVVNPVGPEDPKVYWRRRALVVAIVVVTLFLIWLIFLRSDSGNGDQQAAPAPSPSTAESGAESSGTQSPTTTETTATTDGGTCADGDIEVAVEPDADTYPAGTTPEITLTIQNTGSESCTRNIGSDANSIEVSSGGVRVWSSDDCGDEGSPDVETLEPDKIASVTVEWPRTISAEGCPTPPGEQPEAQAGSYSVVGSNMAVESDEVTFTLE